MAEDTAYPYPPRETGDLSRRHLRLGEGRISGYISSGLGILNLLGMLAFKFPTWFTTADLRAVYDVDVLRVVLQVCLVASLAFGTFTFVRGRRRRMGMIGIGCTLLAILIGGWAPEPGALKEGVEVGLGLDWLVLDLLGSAVVFITIEKMLPRYPDQPILRPHWRLDLMFFTMNHLAIGVLLLVGNYFAPHVFYWAINGTLQAWVRSIPVWGQFAMLVFFADLAQYWIHRAFHEIPWLWPFHAVHHSTEYMDWLAGSRTHFVQVLVDRTLVMVPLYLLGADAAALNAYVIFAGFHDVYIHANTGMHFGWLRYLIATPQYHHWHHSSERPAIDTNYAVHLPVLDMVFGTYHLPVGKWPAKYGTVSPIPMTFTEQLAYPFLPPPPPPPVEKP